jgi:hypothetical protein
MTHPPGSAGFWVARMPQVRANLHAVSGELGESSAVCEAERRRVAARAGESSRPFADPFVTQGQQGKDAEKVRGCLVRRGQE